MRKPKEGCCIAGTEVLLCDGTTIPIESLQEGDEVWGFYHDTGQWVCAPVLATSVREVDVVVDLEVDPDGAGPLAAYTLTGTLEHPFFVPVRGEYVPMGELGAGDGLRREDGGEAVVVDVGVRYVRAVVFNLEVEGVHNYFVRPHPAVGEGVLAHNTLDCLKLKRLHPDSSLKPRALAHWRAETTEKIVQSLTTPGDEMLRIRPDGTVLQGNHRVKILEERGFDTSILRDDAIIELKDNIAPWE